MGNPINTATGNKFQEEIDITQLQGGLEFHRFYNSGQQIANGALGDRWRHSYSREVFQSATTPSELFGVYRPAGNIYYFRRDGSAWVGDSDVADRLIEIKSGSVRTGWRYIVASTNESELYDSNGKLSSISFPSGNFLKFTYSDGSSGPNGGYFLDVNGASTTKILPAGMLIRITDAFSRSLAIGYSYTRAIRKIMGPDGYALIYRYDADNNLSSVTYPDGRQRKYLYNEPSNTSGASLRYALTGIVDEDNARFATYQYDSSGNGVSTQHGSGIEKFAVSYLSDGSSDVQDPLGSNSHRAFVAGQGMLRIASRAQSCAGCITTQSSYTYDANGNLDTSTDANGNSTDYDYNSRGLLIQTVSAATSSNAKRTIQTDWHPEFAMPSERRTLGATGTIVSTQNWSYNARGQVLTASSTDPASGAARAVTTTYCEQADVVAGICPLVGLVKSIDGSRTDVADTTTYTYYHDDDATCSSAPAACSHRKGDLWKVTNAFGQTIETLRYDGSGRVSAVKGVTGTITDYEYYPRGWLAATKVRGGDDTTEADDRITLIEYWPTGLVKQVTQPDGSFTSYAYDAAHRLTDIVDGLGNTIHYTLDNAGNRTQEDTKDASGTLKRTLSRIFNQLGQLQTQKDALNHPTGFTYDPNGNTDQVTDALNRVADNDYDPLNRLKRTLQDVGGIAAETKFEYDTLDNLTKVTDPKGLDTTYGYNGLGDLLTLNSPDTGVASYTYDSAGNRKTQTDARGVASSYGYDALNRLTSVTYPSDSSLDTSYEYDMAAAACATGETFATGRLSQMTDGSGSTQYCYDRFGQLVRKVQTTNGQVFVLRYAYTVAGQLSSLTYPDGAVADYVRDAQGRVVEVGVTRNGSPRQVLLNQASYAPFGPITGWTYGNGRSLSRGYNQNYQPATIQDTASGGLDLGFGFDPVGNLTQLTPAANSTPVASYDYDTLNRLTARRDQPSDTVVESYTYDATGNRTSATDSLGTQTYTYPANGHRLTQVVNTIRLYDEAGNTTANGTKGFGYNAANRMASVSNGTTVVRRYAYNGRGEQVRRQTDTSNSYAVYDEVGHWLGEYAGDGSPVQQAIWLDDLPVGLLSDNQLHYVEADHLGTPRAVIDPVRNLAVWSWPLKSEAFGDSAPNTDPDGDGTYFVFDLRFPGQRYDAASGMNYNYLRDGYDAGTGRYTQSDPIGLVGGISTYGYALQQPTQVYDKLGLNPAVVGGAVILGAIQGCAGGCAGAVVGDYASCVVKKRFAGGKNLGQCSDECTPNPCDALKSCISGCVAGAILGGITAGRGVALTPIAGFLLKKYFRFLFSPDFCRKYGIPAPPDPNPIPLPDWLRDL